MTPPALTGLLSDLQTVIRGGVQDPTYLAAAMGYPAWVLVSQQASLPGNGRHSVPIYNSEAEIDATQQKCRWTEDPRGGRFDVVRHPRFFEEAAAVHPDFAEDCDGFMIHRCAALTKGRTADGTKLADEVWAAHGMWDGSGHAVTVYRRGPQWRWVSNWNGCRAMDLPSRDAFRAAMETYRKVKITRAALWPVVGLMADDTVLLGPPIVLP